MFRKMAIALVAASVFTAPVLAQNPSLSGGTTSTPSSDPMDKTKPEKTEKSAESVEKSVTKHRTARHHHRGIKAAKYGKAHATTAMSSKKSIGKTAKLAKTAKLGKTEKFAKAETRRKGHGKAISKHVYGRASKRMHTPSGTPAQ